MKKLITIILILALQTTMTRAAVLTVSNSLLGGAQYSSLWDAYLAAVSGQDTLSVEGTDIPYFLPCHAVWEKNLIVIGIGFNPQKQYPLRSKIRDTDCQGGLFYLSSLASGSAFYGIEFTHSVVLTGAGNTSDLLFEDCIFDVTFDCGGVSLSSFVFRNCIFTRDNDVNFVLTGGSPTYQGVITNCVLDGYILANSNLNTILLVDHCIFLSTTTGSFSDLYYSQIQNSIFVNYFPAGLYNCDLNNNLSMVTGTFPPDPAQGNIATNNIENTDAQFVNYTSGSLYSATADYDVQAGSPAVGAASDGTDIGVHGGTANFSETGEVLIAPIMRSMTILNSSIESNGTLNVQIHAAIPNTD